MESIFRESYAKLNKQQKLAVDTIDGPLLVIAGPGTGKTQLLSLRVANILKSTDALEENILGLTFTESAVQEMRQRLDQVIGQSAYKITINTYHGFGSDLIQQNPTYFSGVTNLQPASPLLTTKILRDIVSKLKVTNSFKDTVHLGDVKSLISDFKKAALYPKDIRKVIKQNIDFIEDQSKITIKLSPELALISKKAISSFNKLLLPNVTSSSSAPELLSSLWNKELEEALEKVSEEDSTKPLTAWKTKWLEKNEDANLVPSGRAQNQRLSEFVDIYELYIEKMNQLGRYDFDDMILKSIEALKKYPEFRYTLQEQYQYILLDEYQDTNEAQAELIGLLCDSPVNEGRPNIMAVGDDDQAIYTFQGASHSHMLSFYKSYKDVKLITLDTNYRSNQKIIDLSTSLANQIASGLSKQIAGINKKFTTGTKEKGLIVQTSLVDQPSEFAWIAENILKTTKKNEYSKVAILAPRHKYLTSLVTYLQASNIPINYERREDVLSDPLIEQLINICRLLLAIEGDNKKLVDSLLSVVLNYEFWQLKTESIWQLSWDAHDTKQDWLRLMIKDKYFSKMALFLIKLSSNAQSQRFDVILDQIMGLSETKIIDQKIASYKSPFYEFYKNDQQLTLRTFSSLLIIRNQFLDYSEDNPGPLLISDFIDFVDNHTDSGQSMINTSPYIESEQAVQLMTAYKAKGREFDEVYMLSSVDEVWGPSSRQRSSFVSLPPNLKYTRHQSLDNDDEKLRLIYVAMSRAKNNLYISSYQKTDSSKDTRTLNYFTQIKTEQLLPKGETRQINLKAIEANTSRLMSYYTAQYRPLLEKADTKQSVKQRLEGYQLNASDLNTFLDVRNAGPDAFYNKVVLKYRNPDSKAISYGSAIHRSLEFLQRQLSENNKLPTTEQVQKEFVKELKRSHLSNDEFDDLVEKGTQTIETYITKNKQFLSPKDLSEVSFKNDGVVIGGAHLNGNIDKLILDKDNNKLTIVDYKTGKPHYRWTSEVALHLYRNQLYFYKLLVNNSRLYKNLSVDSAFLDFVQADDSTKSGRLELIYDEQELERIKKLITAVWQHISKLNFPDISKYSVDLKGITEFEEDLISGKI